VSEGLSETMVQAMRTWRASPNSFVRNVIRVTPDDWQDDVLEAVAAGDSGVGNAINPAALRRICLKASKGPGKSAILSWIGWWFLFCHVDPKVVCSSISGDNLADGLWSEFAYWLGKSPILQRLFLWHAERIVSRQRPETWWCSARQWSRSANPTEQGETLAGIHARHVLFLLDESGGIPDAVAGTAEAGLANADPAQGTTALLVQAGNPVRNAGPLYRACTSERELWWIKEISGDPDDPKRAKRISIDWARELIRKYGRDHPIVRVGVLGKFPLSDMDTLVGLEDAVAASKRSIHEREFEHEVKVLGVDVARFGDDETCMVLRQGRAVYQPKALRTMDLMQVTGNVALVIDKHHPDAVFVDQTGVGGGVVDRLRELGYDVIGVDNAGSPVGQTDVKCANRRAEQWWVMAGWLKEGGVLPDDPVLVGELPAPTYKIRSDGCILIEAKADMKKRGVASPNRADALALTFAAPVAHREVREVRRAKQEAQRASYHPYNNRR
jgi:phage terminase large subunit